MKRTLSVLLYIYECRIDTYRIKQKAMSKTGGRPYPQTGKWETKEFRGVSRAQKP